jgi:hypothetical protein
MIQASGTVNRHAPDLVEKEQIGTFKQNIRTNFPGVYRIAFAIVLIRRQMTGDTDYRVRRKHIRRTYLFPVHPNHAGTEKAVNTRKRNVR